MWNNYGMGNPYMPPMQTPMQNQMQQQTPQIIFDFVQSFDAARNYPIPPNGKAMLMDMNNCFIYSKIADAFGKIDMRTFKFTEVNAMTQIQEDTPKLSMEDIDKRLARIEELLANKEHHNG